MSNAVYNHDREDEARSAALRQWGLDRATPAQVVPLDMKRRPLGLAPASGPDNVSEPPASISLFTKVSAEARAAPARVGDCVDAADVVAKFVMNDVAAEVAKLIADVSNASGDKIAALERKFEARIAKLEVENNELKTALIEARHETRELKFVQESMRVAGRGERGVDGARGVPGRDLITPGPRGEQGPRGERGLPAPKIVSWEIADVALAAYPRLSTGHRGPGLHMRPLLDAYSDLCASDDDAGYRGS